MCGLCGFLYKDAERVGPVGATLHGMLGPMARRGTDSTGIALYGPPQADSYVVRARVDASDNSLARRVAIAHHDGVPFQIVLGDRELAGGTLAIRARDAQWWAPNALAIADLAKRCTLRA